MAQVYNRTDTFPVMQATESKSTEGSVAHALLRKKKYEND